MQQTLRVLVGAGVALALIAAAPAMAAPRLAAPFTDHAVLQQGRTVPVRGEAEPDSEVTLSLDGAVIGKASTDRAGRWVINLPSQPVGGPHRILARSASGEVAIDDVQFGDVWLCSGQSNMEFPLRRVTNAETEVAQSTNPQLRLLQVERLSSAEPQAHFAGGTAWQVSGPDSAAEFSAACYFMGQQLQRHQNIPIGLINASWGGSMIEEWLSREALGTLPRYQAELALLDSYRHNPQLGRQQWAQRLTEWLGPRIAPPSGAKWQTVPQLTFWEDWAGGRRFFDGIAYYRAKVILPAAPKGPAALIIGSVDDMDVTRVDGKVVGADQGWNTQRSYALPKSALHRGENIIDIVVVDTGGGGGVWGAVPELRLANGTVIPIAHWEFAGGEPLAKTGIPAGMPWLGGSGRTTLFNGMIAPLGDMPVTGFAWYQGEANVGDPAGYAELMPLLAQDWRRRFGGKAFLITQLANFGGLASQPSNDAWGRFRDVQRRVADADPDMGMASAVDIGQPGDIHPTNKQDVGLRLALAARHHALGEKVMARGPSPLAARRTAEGIVVDFAYGPLRAIGGSEVIGFELCGPSADCRFVRGEVVTAHSVRLPPDAAATEIRYLWQASPIVNLYNEAGLPATGFSLALPRP